MPATLRGTVSGARRDGRAAPATVLMGAALCLHLGIARAAPALDLTPQGGTATAGGPAVAAPAPDAGLLSARTGPGPLAALVSTTLIGAAFGLADRAGFYRWDHPVHRDTSGIWGLARTPTLPAVLIGSTAAAAFFEGGTSRVGRTLWQGLDGAALAGASTYVLKYSFGRERPSQTTNPDVWGKGAHAQSFPSGDVSAITGLVTPAILEYRHSDPAVYALAALPVFDMVARVKAQGHWQTDVVGAALVGGLSGYFAHVMPHPLILSLMPHGVELGLKRYF